MPVRDSGSLVSSPFPDSTASVGSYRLLGGIGYFVKSLGGAHAFVNKPPDVLAPDVFNRSEAVTQTRVAYGTGMSEWCLNCHGSMHQQSSEPLRHPFGPGDGELRRDNILDHYNSYIMTGDLSGTEATSYLSLVPFEIGTGNYTILRTIATATPTKGPSEADGTPLVMCLSCHRAHASGWDNMTRWNARSQYIVYNGSYSQEGAAYQPYGQGRTEIEALRANYDIPAGRFAAQQLTLCTKCHESMP
jgi:cytochrome c553